MIENEIGEVIEVIEILEEIENEEIEIENEEIENGEIEIENEEEENGDLADHHQTPLQIIEVLLLLHLLLPLIHQVVEAGADLRLVDTEISLHVVNETGEIEAEAEIDETDHLENLVKETSEKVEILVIETMREII